MHQHYMLHVLCRHRTEVAHLVSHMMICVFVCFRDTFLIFFTSFWGQDSTQCSLGSDLCFFA